MLKLRQLWTQVFFLVCEFIAGGIHWKVYMVDFMIQEVSVSLELAFLFGNRCMRTWPPFFLSSLISMSVSVKVNDGQYLFTLTFPNPQIRDQAPPNLHRKHPIYIGMKEFLLLRNNLWWLEVFLVMTAPRPPTLVPVPVHSTSTLKPAS